MLVLYAAADRYLAPAGRLGMVITQTLFQTKGAGDGFRRFRLGADGAPLRVLRVDDLVDLRPFGDAANWTSVVVLQKGEPTIYPVKYVKWSYDGPGEGQRTGRRRGRGRGRSLPSLVLGRGAGGEGELFRRPNSSPSRSTPHCPDDALDRAAARSRRSI